MAGQSLLLPLTYGLSVRYALPTGLATLLADRGSVVIGLGWEDVELEAAVRSMGLEVVPLPPAELTPEYRNFRRRLGALRDRRLASPTTRLRRARQAETLRGPKRRAVHYARRWRDDALVATRVGAAWSESAEPQRVEAGTNVAEFRRILDRYSIGSVLSLTPYHDQDALLLWAARSTGRPSITSMISFDNPTTRERLLVRSEKTLVWNRYNKDELLRSYPDLDPLQIQVIGAPQFDLHSRPDLVLPRSTWCDQLGIAADRPVILYGAGPASLVPSERRIVHLIDEAISSSRIPGQPQLLVRRHPADPAGTWHTTAGLLRNGLIVDPWLEGPESFRSWPTHDDVVMQMSTLAHADVHVNVCSSMSLDGAMFDRPQIGPAFVPGSSRSEQRRVQEFYEQEHWRPIRRSGAVAEVRNEAELVAELSSAFTDPASRRHARRAMVEDVLTFTDGRSSERLVEYAVASIGGGPG